MPGRQVAVSWDRAEELKLSEEFDFHWTNMVVVDTQHFIMVQNVNQSSENSAPLRIHPLSAIQPPNIPCKGKAIAAPQIVYSATRLLFDWPRCFAFAVYIIDHWSLLPENVFCAAAAPEKHSAPSPTITLTGFIAANFCVLSHFVFVVVVVFCSLYCFDQSGTDLIIILKLTWSLTIITCNE